MASIINSISFQNFYNYFGPYDDNKYEFTEGINIINADNNMGKTKFYNGVLWMLKDNVYDNDDKEIQTVKDSYIKMASGKAKSTNSSFTMGVCIEYTNDNVKYEITKEVNFNKKEDDWDVSEQLVTVYKEENNCKYPIYDVSMQENIIQSMIPLELRNYALLQGEFMGDLVDLSKKTGLSTTINVLSGISSLVEVLKTTQDVSDKAHSEYNHKNDENNKDDTTRQELRKKQERNANNLVQAEKLQCSYKESLSNAIQRYDKYKSRILNTGNRIDAYNQIKSLEKNISKLEEDKDQKEKQIANSLFNNATSWLLLGMSEEIDEYTSIWSEYQGDRAFKRKQMNSFLLPDDSPDKISLQRMLDTETCEICGRKAYKNTEHWQHIYDVLHRNDGRKKDINDNDFNKFYSDIFTSISIYKHKIPEINDSIQSYKDSIADLKEKIDSEKSNLQEAETKFRFLGGSDESVSSDEQIMSEFELAESDKKKYQNLIESNKESIKIYKDTANNLANEIQKHSRNSKEIDSYKQIDDDLKNILEMFQEAKARIYDEIIRALEKNANEKYEELTAGNQTLGGRLEFRKQCDDNIEVSIIDQENGIVTGLGTGFQRMKQLAIIMAIISSKIGNKKFDYPFISDAPLSEFGIKFIKNFFNIAPRVFTQSIVLIKEFYYSDYENPRPHESYLNDFGENFLKEMKEKDIAGTFYVNYCTEKNDPSKLVTCHTRYK